MLLCWGANSAYSQEQRMTAGVNYPASVTVGTTGVAVNLSFGNTSLPGGGVTDMTIRLLSLTHQVSCNTQPLPGAPCSPGQEENPPVFTPTGSGTGSLDCSGTNFTISPTGTPGQYNFSPDAPVDLTIGQNCSVAFTVTVNKVPQFDASLNPGIQTAQDVIATGQVISQVPPGGDGIPDLVGQTAGAASNDLSTVSYTCAVLVDKQVSCGDGFQDVGLVSGNEDGTNGCTSSVPGLVTLQYQAQNAGNLPLSSCTLTESNGAFATPVFPSIDVGETTPVFGSNSNECSSTLDDAEPDNVHISCECDAGADGIQIVEADDSADFACVNCEVDLVKEVSCNGSPFGASCDTFNGNDVVAQWSLYNNGDVEAQCQFDDSNTFFSRPGESIVLPVDGSPTVLSSTSTCSDDFEAMEPNTATLDCECATDAGTIDLPPIQRTANIECFECGALVDKQISCNGGAFVDPGLVAADEDGTNGCFAPLGAPVTSQYFIQNTGDTPITCGLVDSNTGGTLLEIAPGSIAVDATQTSPAQTGFELACSSELDSNEPNQATATCTCTTPGGETQTASAFDRADIGCGDISLTKECVGPDSGGMFTSVVQIDSSINTAISCDLTDQYYPGECPADPSTPPSGSPTDVTMAPDPLGVGPLEQDAQSTGTFSPGQTVCNVASTVCTGASLEGTLEDSARDTCPVGQGCFTRTPGFWKGHLFAVDAVIPVVSCGLVLDNHTAGLEGSTVEDLCVNNNEAKFGTSPPTSSQQFQLVRQCAAAALNLAASAQAGLACETEFPGISATFAECCGVGIQGDLDFTRGVCNNDSTPYEITASGCIGSLDAFNNAFFPNGDGEDVIADLAGPDWNDVETDQCQIADSNHWLNDSNEDNGRLYGPQK